MYISFCPNPPMVKLDYESKKANTEQETGLLSVYAALKTMKLMVLQ